MSAVTRFLLGMAIMGALVLAAIFLLMAFDGQSDGSAPATPHSQPSPYPHAWEIKTR